MESDQTLLEFVYPQMVPLYCGPVESSGVAQASVGPCQGLLRKYVSLVLS